MTVLEAVRLGDVFVPALVYRLTSLPRDDNEAAFASLVPHPHFAEMPGRELVSRLRESTAVRAAGAVVSEAGWDHHVSITTRAWAYSPGCPALRGKECSIHARRPHTCRTVPIRYDVPAGLLVRAFRGAVDAGRASIAEGDRSIRGSATSPKTRPSFFATAPSSIASTRKSAKQAKPRRSPKKRSRKRFSPTRSFHHCVRFTRNSVAPR